MKTLKECLDEALLNGMIGAFMGWDEKHGPTLEELEGFERFFGGSIEKLFNEAREPFVKDDLEDEWALDHEASEWVEPSSALEDRACRDWQPSVSEYDID
jgi:hypothetical protein